MFLFLLVLFTAIQVGFYIKKLVSCDKNVIHLVPKNLVIKDVGDVENNLNDDFFGAGNDGLESVSEIEESEVVESKPIPVLPGFEGSDLKGLWRNQTIVDIFKDYYNETTGIWTVWSRDGGKVIAPGTGNDYVFQLKNTGNISMDYVLTIESTFDMGDVRVPIEVRLKTADGTYIAGDENTWIYPEELNEVVENGTLDVNHYANYVLQWRWPFEPEYAAEGWNLNDTLVGYKAVHEDLNFTMAICTTAIPTPGAKPVDGFGVDGPRTGDNSNIVCYMIGLAIAVMVMALILFARKRNSNNEKEKNENEV